MKVSVLGCGRWGSFISWYMNRIGNKVLTFGRKDSESFKKLKEKVSSILDSKDKLLFCYSADEEELKSFIENNC